MWIYHILWSSNKRHICRSSETYSRSSKIKDYNLYWTKLSNTSGLWCTSFLFIKDHDLNTLYDIKYTIYYIYIYQLIHSDLKDSNTNMCIESNSYWKIVCSISYRWLQPICQWYTPTLASSSVDARFMAEQERRPSKAPAIDLSTWAYNTWFQITPSWA